MSINIFARIIENGTMATCWINYDHQRSRLVHSSSSLTMSNIFQDQVRFLLSLEFSGLQQVKDG